MQDDVRNLNVWHSSISMEADQWYSRPTARKRSWIRPGRFSFASEALGTAASEAQRQPCTCGSAADRSAADFSIGLCPF
jgi:hypothetical protein